MSIDVSRMIGENAHRRQLLHEEAQRYQSQLIVAVSTGAATQEDLARLDTLELQRLVTALAKCKDQMGSLRDEYARLRGLQG